MEKLPDRRIEEKISNAENFYAKHKKKLLSDKKISRLLEEYLKLSSENLKEMARIGLVEECRKCEEDEGGACCGSGIENKYSETLLLINLLLGQKLPAERADRKSCYFLGIKGCSLRARHVICINYICKKAADSIPARSLNHLREKEGKELNTLFILNERINSALRDS